jgi:hypothetical protein
MMGESAEMEAVVAGLLRWADAHGLTARVIAAWEREYAEQLSRPIAGPKMPRNIVAEFISHDLEFYRPTESIIPPRVVSRLQLTVMEGHCVVGTFELDTDLDGVSRGTRLDLTPLGEHDWNAEYTGTPDEPF